MVSYELLIKQSAATELEAATRKDRQRIARRINQLRLNPRPHGCEKLSGEEKYRIRQGVFRIIYGIDDEAQRVTIIKIAHRRDVYRK